MRIEDVIEALNWSIRDKRKKDNITSNSFLVLHKSILPDEKFKSYKNFKYDIWVVDGKNKYRVIEYNEVYNITTPSQLEVYSALCDLKACSKIFDFIGSDLYLDVIKGIYETN